MTASEVRLELIDAAELAETVGFISQWLTGTDHVQLTDSFRRFALAAGYDLTALCHSRGVDTDRLSLLKWQFSVAWRLTDLHLTRLTDAACLWKPSEDSWTVRMDDKGAWRADWTGEDPESPAPPTIAWLSWHVIWWWSGTLAAVAGDTPQEARSVAWPGDAHGAQSGIRSLSQSWSRLLDSAEETELSRPVSFPRPEPRPLIYALFWVNLELTKNAAEIGEVMNMFVHRAK